MSPECSPPSTTAPGVEEGDPGSHECYDQTLDDGVSPTDRAVTVGARNEMKAERPCAPKKHKRGSKVGGRVAFEANEHVSETQNEPGHKRMVRSTKTSTSLTF
jgi:hypothetical protein